jgi:hypothetical protein
VSPATTADISNALIADQQNYHNEYSRHKCPDDPVTLGQKGFIESIFDALLDALSTVSFMAYLPSPLDPI